MRWQLCILSVGFAFHVGASAQSAEEAADEAGWSAMAQLGAGYDTNANVSTRKQSFIGFILDPRYVQSESAFGELSLSADHTAIFTPETGMNSSLQLAHRVNPAARFADQTVTSIGAEAVRLVGNARFAAGVSAYTSWLARKDYERGAHFELGASYHPGETFDTALSIRTSRLNYEPRELRQLDVDRYLLGWTFTRRNLGPRSGSIGLALLGGRDAPRRASSAFGNHRAGLQISTSWPVFSRASLYAEAGAMRVDYTGRFFDLDREDDQFGAAIALELSDWPTKHWSVTPQVRYERTASPVSVFEYDRAEAAVYVRRQY